MSMYDNKIDLLNHFGIKENFLYSNFSNKYKVKILKKKSGGERTIKAPISKLKTIQRKILDEIVAKVQPLECVYGLSKEKGVKDNAMLHSKNWNREVLCLDLVDFFNNIHYKNINSVYKGIGFNRENSNVLTKLSTLDKALPQGSPLSSHLSSLSVLGMDNDISRYVKSRGLIYSRYVDDVTISGKTISEKYIREIKEIINKHKMRTNDQKEKLYKSDEEKNITGVRLIKNNITITDQYEKNLLVMSKDGTSLKDRTFLGKLSFYKYLNKKRYKEFIKNLFSRFGK